jgi:transcriptional regulator with XRE-family HTH domain
MPPKKRIIRTCLPDRERAVCARLREVRQHLRFTQAEFAEQIGISRERLASYEDARAPLRLDCGLKICRQFLVSEKWLADGLRIPKRSPNQRQSFAVRFGGPSSRLFMDLASEIEIDAKTGRIPFSQGFEKLLSSKYERADKTWRALPILPKIVLSPSDNVSLFRNVLSLCVDVWLQCLGDDMQKQFLWVMVRCARIVHQELGEKTSTDPAECFFERALDNVERADFGAGDAEDVWSWGYKIVPASPGEIVPVPSCLLPLPIKTVLTRIAESGKLAPVKSQLKNLLADLNRLTREPGKKTKLADFLGAPLTSVSRWLSGEREPGGETTLRLLEWVLAEEAKQPKSPARATTRAERKTQVRKSVYEKQTQVRKKG